MFTYSDVLLKLVVGFLFITILINLTGKGNLAPHFGDGSAAKLRPWWHYRGRDL